MFGQSGRGLSDFRHLLHVLRSALGHLHTLLEDFSDGEKADQKAAGTEGPDGREGGEDEQ